MSIEEGPAATTEPAKPYTMSSITGKLVLALIRENDYAHAGEEEAIERVLAPLGLQRGSRVLDVGCGIGGTASYVEQRGWGKVTGIDLDPDNIEVARKHHPGPEFTASDVADLEQHVNGPFDAVYLFNAFFLFPDRPAALAAMRGVAAEGARLALFDYVDTGGYHEWQSNRETAGLRSALRLEEMRDELPAAGWKVERIEELNEEYLRWYQEFVDRIVAKRSEVVAISSEGFYEYVLTQYSETLDDTRAGRLGGATFYATAV